MKKTLAIILALVITISSMVVVFASDDPRPDGVIKKTVELQ